MPGDHDYLDSNFHSESRFEMEQAAKVREAAEWLGMDYVSGQLEDAGRSGMSLYRSEIIDQLGHEAFVLMDARRKSAEPGELDQRINEINSEEIFCPSRVHHSSNILESTVESLNQLSRELYLVPVSAKRLVHLRNLVQRSVVQNQDGQWTHVENCQFAETRPRARTTQADVNRYVEDILIRSNPDHWLLSEEQKRQFEEVLRARILSPAHTDPLFESERKAEARREGRVYNPPVGEGLRAIGEDLDLVSDDAALWVMAARRTEREPSRPLLLHEEDGSPRSERDFIKDMSWSERKYYKKQKQNNDQSRAAIIQNARKAAHENRRIDIWQHNVNYRARDYIFNHYEKLGHSPIYLAWITRTTVTGKEVKLITRCNEVQMQEVLAWGKLEALARMHLHNELVRSKELSGRGDRALEASLISNPYLSEIVERSASSYLDFLRKVADGSRETNIQSPDFSSTLVYDIMIAGRGRLNALYRNVYIDDSLREMMPMWFASEAISLLPIGRDNA